MPGASPRSSRGPALSVVGATGPYLWGDPQWPVQWAVFHEEQIINSLAHVLRRMPSAFTFRRTLHQVDIRALEREMARLGRRLDEDDPVPGCVVGPHGEELRGQAIDGQEGHRASVQGVKVELVSLGRHGSGAVLGQRRVEVQSKEIPAVRELLVGHLA